MRNQPRILIVEDEPAIAELMSVNLRHNGFQPVWAMDAITAQKELDEVLPDVVLLDWMLPGESGLSLAKRWRGNPRTKAVPILMITARGDEPDRVAGLDAGADDYIAKPFHIREVVLRIRRTLDRYAGPVENGPALRFDHVRDLGREVRFLLLDSLTESIAHKSGDLHRGAEPDPERAEASYERGLLTVVMPLAPKPRAGRILIVLGFVRTGLGTPTAPPNQVLVGSWTPFSSGREVWRGALCEISRRTAMRSPRASAS